MRLQRMRDQRLYRLSLSIVIGMQLFEDDDELSIITSISFESALLVDDGIGLSSLESFVTISLNISDVDEPTLLASTPLSPEVEPTSMLSCRSFDDEATADGDCESFSSSEIDERGDEVEELLKTFVVMNIFGVERPPVSQPLWFDESGLGHVISGDMMGDEPRLKLQKTLICVMRLNMCCTRALNSPFSENLLVGLRRCRTAASLIDHFEFPLHRTERARSYCDWRHRATCRERSSRWWWGHSVL